MIQNAVLTLGNKEVVEKDINFYDYDGTLVESWTLEELQSKTALPFNPVHEGLIAQGWNWTLEELKADNGMTDVGQNYITDDGKTRLYLFFESSLPLSSRNITLKFNQNIANGVVIDWGDGSTTETIANTGNVSTTHQYNNSGHFVLTLAPSGNTVIAFDGKVLGKENTILIKAELGSGFTQGIGDSAFNGCFSLETISVPNYVINSNRNKEVCFNCYKLICFIIPRSMNGTGDAYFNAAHSLKVVSLPPTFNAIAWESFYGDMWGINKLNVRRVTSSTTRGLQGLPCIRFVDLSNATGTISHLTGMKMLEKIILGSGITSLINDTLRGSTILKEVIFKGTTPPTIANSTAFSSVYANCLFFIPYDSTAYLSATNYPNPATYTYLGYGIFTSGATLPTAPTDTGYTLTWYANINDAVAQTNPITTGNGHEVYCRYTEVV